MDGNPVNDIVLLRAKIASIREAQDRRQEPGQVDLGAWFRVELNIVEPLIGNVGSSHAEVELKMAAIPRAETLKDVYVLGRKLPDGRIQAIQWSYASSGLCIQHDLAKTYLIDGEVHSLRQQGRIKWNAQCDW